MQAQEYLEAVGHWLMTSGLQIFLVLLLMIIALKAANVLSERLFKPKKARDDAELQKRTETLCSIVRSILTIAVFIISGMMILEKLGIEIPFPHRTVYIGQDKKGDSPALNIRKG